MYIVLQILLLALGFVFLVKGSDWFVDGAAGIANRFGIPQLIIGLTIVAMGTSAPEAAVSITAAFNGSADITIGNIVGSNILNVLVILGLSVLKTFVSELITIGKFKFGQWIFQKCIKGAHASEYLSLEVNRIVISAFGVFFCILCINSYLACIQTN